MCWRASSTKRAIRTFSLAKRWRRRSTYQNPVFRYVPTTTNEVILIVVFECLVTHNTHNCAYRCRREMQHLPAIYYCHLSIRLASVLNNIRVRNRLAATSTCTSMVSHPNAPPDGTQSWPHRFSCTVALIAPVSMCQFFHRRCCRRLSIVVVGRKLCMTSVCVLVYRIAAQWPSVLPCLRCAPDP